MIGRHHRLPPAEMFPAGVPGLDVRWLTLRSGLRIRAVVAEPPAATRATALFVHGWGCSAYSWHANLRAVADAGVRAIACDLPGHGLSDKPTSEAAYTLPSLARHVAETLDALDLDRCGLVAHSLGGAIALRLAIDASARVAGLVLAAPIGFGAASWLRAVPRIAPRALDPVLPYLAFRWTFRAALWRAYGTLRKPTERDVDEYWAPTADPEFVRSLARIARTFDWSDGRADELRRVEAPAEILFGERDHLVRGDRCAPLVALVPQARARTIEGAGHALPEEVPDVLNATVVAAARRWR